MQHCPSILNMMPEVCLKKAGKVALELSCAEININQQQVLNRSGYKKSIPEKLSTPVWEKEFACFIRL